MKTKKHTSVFGNLSTDQRRTVYLATLEKDRLGERVTDILLADYCGSIPRAIKAFNAGNPDEGNRIFNNLP